MIGFIGWGSPGYARCTNPPTGVQGIGVSSQPSLVQCGHDTVIVNAGTFSGAALITFNPFFQTRPTITLTLQTTGVTVAETEQQISFLAQNGTTTNGVSVFSISTTETPLFTHVIYRGLSQVLTSTPVHVQLQADIISATGTNRKMWVEAFDCNVDGNGSTAWESLGNLANSPGIGTNFAAGYRIGTPVLLNATLWTDILNNGCFYDGIPEVQLRIVAQTTSGSGTLKIASLTLSYTYGPTPIIIAADLLTDNNWHQLQVVVWAIPGAYAFEWIARE